MRIWPNIAKNHMSSFHKKALFSLFFLTCIVLVSRPVLAASREAKDINVLIITIDTLRYDRISILSDRYVRTPFIDDLARQSIIFTRAYAHSVLTRPSHTNIMTGTTPLYHGVSVNPGFKLENRYLTLAELLHDQKYRTGAFIGNFILDARFGLDQGFDLYDDNYGEQTFGQIGFVERSAEKVVEPALRWIERQKGKWFCWIHLFDPHEPYVPPEPFKSEYRDDPYSGEVAYVDAQLGVLFEALRKRDDMTKTIIILTADHGEAFGEKEEVRHGFFAYNNTLHIPLILYYPGARPQAVEKNACHVDIFPTVCDLLGLPVPSHIQGESLLPLIEGKERQKKLIYFESMGPHYFIDAAPLSGFIEGDRKYIDQPIKEVYDMRQDPGEDHNLASEADFPQLAKDLETLKKSLKGKGTKMDLEGREADIRPLLESLGYVAGTPTKKKSYGIQDDVKTLWPLMAQLHIALDDFKAGNRDVAIKKLSNIVHIRSQYIAAISALADAYYNVKQVDKAVATLKDGISKNPDNLHLLGQLGMTLVMAKKYDEAVEPLKIASSKDKDNPDYFNYLGMAYMGSLNFELAEENFIKARTLEPDLLAVYNNLGYLYLALFIRTSEEKYYDSSIQNFDKVLAANPANSSAKKGKEAAIEQKNKLQPVLDPLILLSPYR
jgi:arylsulfatase A-like enzyme/Tfp pilus assembly protein PilF